MSVKTDVTKLFETRNELTVKEITDYLGVSKQMVHITLNQLMEENFLEKLGRAPKTIYRLLGKRKKILPVIIEPGLSMEELDFLHKNFLQVSESGSLLDGWDAFHQWCDQRKLPPIKTVHEYMATKKRYEGYYDTHGMINGTAKLKNTKGYDTIWLDELFYLDFYAIERFGKTRLGTLLHYAKQGQNKYLMGIMLKEIASQIKEFIRREKADAIGYVQPTIRREVQIMKYIQHHLQIPLPVINIKKLSGIIPVPQKSLAKLDERIRNAENTFAVTEQRAFRHLVLIDDAVGSGATMNQLAGKIKNKQVAQKITGLAVVGSFKGFDVITDV